MSKGRLMRAASAARHGAWTGLAAGLVGAGAFAAPAPTTPTVSELVVTANRTVSELIVTAKARCLSPQSGMERAERPRVVSSFPARDAVVRPGLLVLRVTFDQPMACAGAFDAAPPLPNPCPGPRRDMLLSYDRRTVRTVCVVESGRSYGVSLGGDPVGDTFIGLSGLPAASARIAFSTSDGPAVSDVCDGLAEDPQTARELRDRGKTCAPGR
jgi:hypothetical protein